MLLRLACAVSLILLFSGCAVLVKEPRIVLKEARMVGLDTSGIDVDVHLGVTNPNSFDLSLIGYSYEFLVSALPVSSGSSQETVHFPAGTDTDLRLPVRLIFADLLELMRHPPDPARIPCQFHSRLLLQTPWGEMILPLEKRTVLAIPEEYRPVAYLNLLLNALQGVR
jgi:LEA14-like dessication related protein